ncbi:UNVERIFIED_CONTAM: Alpha-ketoglutarate-dependent dioxygenase alkB 3 [Gekko kuhli]
MQIWCLALNSCSGLIRFRATALGKKENEDYTYVQRVCVPLDHGTLLIMEGATQEDWQHRVPKEYHSREARINLTFRTMYPDPEAV